MFDEKISLETVFTTPDGRQTDYVVEVYLNYPDKKSQKKVFFLFFPESKIIDESQIKDYTKAAYPT